MKALLVTGSRSPLAKWAPSDGARFLNFCLSELGKTETMMVLGGAGGADEFAREFAVTFRVSHTVIYPDWPRYGASAGPIRNGAMVNFALRQQCRSGTRNVLLAAFPGGRGTASMIRICQGLGIRVIHLEDWLGYSLSDPAGSGE